MTKKIRKKTNNTGSQMNLDAVRKGIDRHMGPFSDLLYKSVVKTEIDR